MENASEEEEKGKTKNELRPIGTEFEVVYPPTKFSNSTKPSVMKYQVIAHKKVFKFLGDEEGQIGEVVEAVEIKEKK